MTTKNTERDGWTMIESARPPREGMVLVFLGRAGSIPKLRVCLACDLWPALADRPPRFSAWHNGKEIRIEPAADGQFGGNYSARGSKSMRLGIDAWDGLASEIEQKFLCRPTISEDGHGALLFTLPDGLFVRGVARAAKLPTRPVTAKPPPNQSADRPDGRTGSAAKSRLSQALAK